MADAVGRCSVCHSEVGCSPECTRGRDQTTFNANGCYITEFCGWRALSLAKHYRSMFHGIEAYACMNYIQRTIGDVWGVLKMDLFTPAEAPDAQVRFKFCACLVIEDNTLANDTVEFRDEQGRVLAKIVNLCTTMPRNS